MVTAQLLEFVRQKIARGETIDSTTPLLVTQGWSDADIKEAFAQAAAPDFTAVPHIAAKPAVNWVWYAVGAFIFLVVVGGVAFWLMNAWSADYLQTHATQFDAQRKSDIVSIQGNIDQWMALHTSYAPTLNSYILFPASSKDPYTGKQYVYTTNTAGSTYSLCAVLSSGERYCVDPSKDPNGYHYATSSPYVNPRAGFSIVFPTGWLVPNAPMSFVTARPPIQDIGAGGVTVSIDSLTGKYSDPTKCYDLSSCTNDRISGLGSASSMIVSKLKVSGQDANLLSYTYSGVPMEQEIMVRNGWVYSVDFNFNSMTQYDTYKQAAADSVATFHLIDASSTSSS